MDTGIPAKKADIKCPGFYFEDFLVWGVVGFRVWGLRFRIWKLQQLRDPASLS